MARAKRLLTRLLIILSLGVVAAAVAWLILARTGSNRDTELVRPEVSATAGPGRGSESEDHARTLVGRWRRPDGGYIIEIGSVGADGGLGLAYFNPRPINVSRTAWSDEDGMLHVFVELRDVGYPGATYDLTYDADRDVLTGRYHQPAVGQTFDVEFARLR